MTDICNFTNHTSSLCLEGDGAVRQTSWPGLCSGFVHHFPIPQSCREVGWVSSATQPVHGHGAWLWYPPSSSLFPENPIIPDADAKS